MGSCLFVLLVFPLFWMRFLICEELFSMELDWISIHQLGEGNPRNHWPFATHPPLSEARRILLLLNESEIQLICSWFVSVLPEQRSIKQRDEVGGLVSVPFSLNIYALEENINHIQISSRQISSYSLLVDVFLYTLLFGYRIVYLTGWICFQTSAR